MNASTNCGWWDLMAEVTPSRVGWVWNNPPTAVGGIFKLHQFKAPRPKSKDPRPSPAASGSD
jgi:hypothetical protein